MHHIGIFPKNLIAAPRPTRLIPMKQSTVRVRGIPPVADRLGFVSCIVQLIKGGYSGRNTGGRTAVSSTDDGTNGTTMQEN